MDSKQIEKILWSNVNTKKYFIGCFPADKIPRVIKHPASLVVNLDKSTKLGSHWVAIFVRDEQTVEYFDSFGPLNCLYPLKQKKTTLHTKENCLTEPNTDIYEFLHQFKSIKINKSVYQSIFAPNCGHYCIFFIYTISLGIPFKKILAILDKQPNPNYFVSEFVRKITSKD